MLSFISRPFYPSSQSPLSAPGEDVVGRVTFQFSRRVGAPLEMTLNPMCCLQQQSGTKVALKEDGVLSSTGIQSIQIRGQALFSGGR